MEVTRTNFLEVLKELDEILKNATFLAIDGEFTGLNSGPDANAFDTPAQYYTKLRSGSMDFLFIQFGLAIFTYNEEKGKYSQRSYNFYVFPRPFDRSSPDCRFLCQASSISFLANQEFDFNKLFKYGIPYLTMTDEEKLYKKMEERQRMREEGLDLIPISVDDKPIIEEICSRIEAFIDSEEKELIVDKCNGFVRRLVYQEARLRWPKLVKLESKNDSGNQYIVVNKIGSLQEEAIKEAERKKKEQIEVQEAVGLSAVLRKIADSGKVIVGHNMLLDLCHIIHKFFGPLPETYADFKALVHGLFPKLLDTKIICQSSQFKESIPMSILSNLLETLQSPPFSMPELENVEGRSYSLTDKKLHEAGYDAYVTGICFITLSDHLGAIQTPKVPTVLADSPLLNPYLNKLLMVRLKDYPYINLHGKDPNPSREHVLHITFPKEWRYNDVSQIFQPHGGAHISWLSDTTAYAALNKHEKVGAVIKDGLKRTTYSLKKYKEHQASLENELLNRGDRKRKISERDSAAKEAKDNGTKAAPVVASAAAASSDPGLASKATRVKAKGKDVTQAKRSDEDSNGWEVASAAMRRERMETFSVVRKVRLKGGGGSSSVSSRLAPVEDAAGGAIASATRYTILSDLDDKDGDCECCDGNIASDGEERERGQMGRRNSPKSGLKRASPKKHIKDGSPRSVHRRSAPPRPVERVAWQDIVYPLLMLLAFSFATAVYSNVKQFM